MRFLAPLLFATVAAFAVRAAEPTTAAKPFALMPITPEQIKEASAFFTLDGQPVTPLAQPPARLADFAVLRLWPGAAPLQKGEELIADVPTLTVVLPAPGQATGSAIVVFPGGGYSHLSAREGLQAAHLLAAHGITAFILKYRFGPKYHHPAELDDAQRAIRYVRAHAPGWGLDPHRVGILGFSAGGHLASTAATQFDNGNPLAADPVENASSRPDLQILLYPVITFVDEPNVHRGSRQMLLGNHPTVEEVQALSNERNVIPDTPLAFVVHSTTDTTVPVANSDAYVAALQRHNIPYVYIREPIGPHGFGVTDDWSGQAIAWLRAQKF